MEFTSRISCPTGEGNQQFLELYSTCYGWISSDFSIFTFLFSVKFFLSFYYTDSHSHFFFTTVTNDITNYYPTYYLTRSIDDITLYWYDSNNEVIERRVPWFRRAKSTLLDASISEVHEQQRMENFLQMLKRGLNDTEGESAFQNYWGTMFQHDQH